MRVFSDVVTVAIQNELNNKWRISMLNIVPMTKAVNKAITEGKTPEDAAKEVMPLFAERV